MTLNRRHAPPPPPLVLSRSLADTIGPMVVPQAPSLCTATPCNGSSGQRQQTIHHGEEVEVVVWGGGGMRRRLWCGEEVMVCER